MRDVLFLGQKSIPATEEDLQVGRDLQDTLAANREACVGMAANMIGVKKRIIIVNAGFRDIIMFNPVIVRKSGPYETEEGCLSLPGVRKTKRYQNIEIEYYDWNWKKQRQKFPYKNSFHFVYIILNTCSEIIDYLYNSVQLIL